MRKMPQEHDTKKHDFHWNGVIGMHLCRQECCWSLQNWIVFELLALIHYTMLKQQYIFKRSFH